MENKKRPLCNNPTIYHLAKEVREIVDTNEIYALLMTGNWVAIGHYAGTTVMIKVI